MKFQLIKVTDTLILVADLDDARTIANKPKAVIQYLNDNLVGGLHSRRVYYRDRGPGYRYDELTYLDDQFKGFASCSPGQQAFLSSFGTDTNSPIVSLQDRLCIWD